MKIIQAVFVFGLALCLLNCANNKDKNVAEEASAISDEALIDTVQRKTFQYFWDGAEPTSGMARERFHVDGDYGKYDKNTVTSGGSGFGIMAIISGIERGYITSAQGLERFNKIIGFLEKADSFHGVFPHWWNGETGKVVGFSDKDNGGDLVETSFLFQGLLAVHQYYINGTDEEKALAARIDKLWRAVDWNWHRNGTNQLYWHWSPEHSWEMNFSIHGYNECLITFILAASSPTHGVPASVYEQGWGENGKIIGPHEVEGYKLNMRYQGTEVGPLFWAHYSFLGLDPRGLKDKYADYFEEMKNYTLINRAYCIRNPKGYKGYGDDCWGLTASYSVKGYAAHEPTERGDLGVITPTAALSSIVYTPEESMKVMRKLYSMRDKLMGPYGFYDAFSETDNWYPQKYLAIDQGTTVVMLENYRTGLLWNLFMSHPDVQNGLKKLGYESPHLK